MKKTLLVLAVLATTLASCEKREVKAPLTDCKCGTVTSVDHVLNLDNVNDIVLDNHYTYTVENDCTGIESVETTEYSTGDFVTPTIGDAICLTREW